MTTDRAEQRALELAALERSLTRLAGELRRDALVFEAELLDEARRRIEAAREELELEHSRLVAELP